MPTLSRSLRRLALVALCSLSACGDGGGGTDPDPVPTSLVAVSATTQSAVVGAAVPTPPMVRVLDEAGRAMAGVDVAFAVTAGNGTVGAASVRTDAQGQASAVWTVGTTAQENTLSATVAGLTPVVFRAQAGAAQPTALQKVSGDGQTGVVGAVLADSLAVRVVDAFGNGVPGVEVTFSGLAAAGQDVDTNASGIARAAVTLGTRPGTDTVHAVVPGLGGVKFAVTMLPGPPDTIYRLEGTEQFASAGRPLQVAPLVRVEDAYGNVLAGVPVTFTPAQGSGVAAPATVNTDSLGRARTGFWMLGKEGVNRLVVSAGSASTEFTATGAGVCTQTLYALYGTAQGTLPSTCYVESRPAQVYSVTFPASQGVDFTAVGTNFTPELAVMDAVGRMEMWAPPGSYGTANLRVYAPAGIYQVAAATNGAPANSSYTLSSAPVTAPRCITRLVIPNVTIQSRLLQTPCGEPNVYFVRVPFGGRIRATLTSSDFNPHLIVVSRSGGDPTESIGTGAGSTVQVTKTGLFNPLYQIYVWAQPGVTGAYTLTVERL